jgi:glutathione reductase (NADPH)
MERVLGPFDKAMVDQLVKASEAENIKIMTGASIIAVKKNGEGFSVELGSGEVLETDLVIHGAGRIPDIDDLNLEAAGINYNRRGIMVDEMMKTSNQKVYAVGDCAASLQLARVADQEAHVAASSIASRETGEVSLQIDYEAAPAVLFTYPQLGMVGRTEEELKAEGIKYWASSDTDLSWPNYKRIGMAHAAYKILVDSDSRILGAHFLSDNTTGLVNTFKQAILDGMTVQELYQANIMSPYPSRESDILYMLEPLLE